MRYCLTFLFVLLMPIWVQAREILVLGTPEVSQAVKKEFADQGFGEEIELEFFGGQTEFVLNDADVAKVMISGLDISEGQNKFTAKAEVFADGKPVAQTKLYGRYFVITEVMLPIRDIAKDSIIKKEDLILSSLRANRLREDMLTQENDLVGKQAVRLIKANKPIQKKDIKDEVLIKKGQAVTAVYQRDKLQIMLKLEALEDGAKGQFIKLLNTRSGKEVAAKVIDRSMVEVIAE